MRAHASAKPAPGERLRISLTRIAPRKLDSDNAVGALKHVRDGVADWLGRDDGDPSIEWVYMPQEKASKRYAVRIEVSAAGAHLKSTGENT